MVRYKPKVKGRSGESANPIMPTAITPVTIIIAFPIESGLLESTRFSMNCITKTVSRPAENLNS
jgi:hypothetical protein